MSGELDVAPHHILIQLDDAKYQQDAWLYEKYH